MNLLFRACLLCCLSLCASTTAMTPLLHPLTTEQGLSQDTIHKLLIDRQGFLWLATRAGLNVYDGTQNRQFTPPNYTFQDLNFIQLFEAEDGMLWAGANNTGVFKIDKRQGTAELIFSLNQIESNENPALTDFVLEDNKSLLLAINRAVYRFDLQSKTLENIFEFSAENSRVARVRELALHKKQLFISTTRGLHVLDLRTNRSQQLEFLPSNLPIRKIKLIENQLYIAVDAKLFQLDISQLHKPHLLTEQLSIYDVIQVDQQLWLASQTGLYQLNSQTNHIQPPKLLWRLSDSQYQLSQNTITSILPSPDGGFWLASQNDGAYFWHPRTTLFQTIAKPSQDSQAPSFNQVSAMAVAADQSLWIANPRGVHQLNLQTSQSQSFSYPRELPNNFRNILTRIYPNQQGDLWLRSGLNLHYFSPAKQQFMPAPLEDSAASPILEQQVLGIWYSPQQEFWFFNQQDYYHYQPSSGKLAVIEGLKEQIPLEKARKIIGVLPNQAHTLLISALDQLWTFNLQTKKATLVFQVTPYQPLLERFAHEMAIDKNQLLWVAFDGYGLLAFDLNTLTIRHQFDASNLLLSNRINGFEQDNNGNLWFSSNFGLSKFNPYTLRIEHFSKKDGLPSHEFLFAASAKLQSGELLFGSNRGIAYFDPVLLQEPPQAPAVVITAIQALNQPSTRSFTDLHGQSFQFDHQAQGFKIEFSSLNFRNQNKISYKVWLEGEQNLTYPNQTTPSVIFPELSAGDYQFNVQATSQTTGLSSPVASLTIKVLPAPWLSSLAVASYGGLALILFGVWQYRRRLHKGLLASAYKKVHLSEQRLKQALEAVNSGIWDWHHKRDQLNAQRIFLMLGYNESLNPLTMHQHLSLIHPEDKDGYQQTWLKFINNPERGFDYTYRLQHQAGHWLWFRDIGKVTETDGQRATRVIGTYSNITETRAIKEKARLFGEAFQQTRDWVVLLDPEQRVIAANQSFTDVFGNMDSYLNQPKKHDLGISLHRRRFYTSLLARMTANQHWQGEELVISPDGAERPTLINISAVGEKTKVEFYVLVFTDITLQKQAEDNLRYLANYDALTGLPNRTLLMERIHHAIEQAKREQRTIALCFIDLDKFKQVNDSLGHDIGDLLLKQVANRLSATLRLTDTVARLGGDEFIVLLEGYKDTQNVSHVARKMLRAIAEPMHLNNHQLSVSPSIGIALYPDDAKDAMELLKHADVAMYHAKDSGRNNYQFFIEEMNHRVQMQLLRESRLRTAFVQDEFINYYQPIYDTLTQQIVGVEVLLRWQNQTAIIPPSEFVPLAEDLRLIEPMTQALLIRALADLKMWHQAGAPLYISVNLSPTHLEQENFAAETAALLAQSELPAHCLRFEVTESALMQDHQKVIATMLSLSDLGVQLALDDFGTGYSSLKYLKELPIDAIKIDRSFVKDIGIDPNDETIIETMLSMAQNLGMYCIAEGVETEQQLAFFTARGCYLIQGYLFGKPMTAEKLTATLQSQR